VIARRPGPLLAALAVVLVGLALLRPLDHDESQYVAAATLSARGWLPYRDYAYLQTPLQPLLLAPIAWISGSWAWPALRVVNALLGVAAVAGVRRAARVAGSSDSAALIAAALFATCDVLLFSTGTARNDALPAAMLAWALVPMVRGVRGEGSRGSAALAGLLLSGAAAAKVSYAFPAAAYGMYALVDRRQRPIWIALGAVPMIALVGLFAVSLPEQFRFEVFGFPAHAPSEYYIAQGRAWKLGWGIRLLDSLKFLALGPALIAAWLVASDRRPERASPVLGSSVGRLLGLLIVAGMLAAVLPAPTWRQYWLPALVPLFVRLALSWDAHPPRRAVRVAVAVFACAGLAPSAEALLVAAHGEPIAEAMRQGAAIGAALDREHDTSRVATLSPQFLPAAGRAVDPHFATGPFSFRSHNQLTGPQEMNSALISRDRLDTGFVHPPGAILVGGEGPWTSGDAALDGVLETWAVTHHYRAVPVEGGRFRLYLERPRVRQP
jgi:4-amino-4-deoxy-L-arabinose transferase-like glycosyltransferase